MTEKVKKEKEQPIIHISKNGKRYFTVNGRNIFINSKLTKNEIANIYKLLKKYILPPKSKKDKTVDKNINKKVKDIFDRAGRRGKTPSNKVFVPRFRPPLNKVDLQKEDLLNAEINKHNALKGEKKRDEDELKKKDEQINQLILRPPDAPPFGPLAIDYSFPSFEDRISEAYKDPLYREFNETDNPLRRRDIHNELARKYAINKQQLLLEPFKPKKVQQEKLKPTKKEDEPIINPEANIPRPVFNNLTENEYMKREGLSEEGLKMHLARKGLDIQSIRQTHFKPFSPEVIPSLQIAKTLYKEPKDEEDAELKKELLRLEKEKEKPDIRSQVKMLEEGHKLSIYDALKRKANTMDLEKEIRDERRQLMKNLGLNPPENATMYYNRLNTEASKQIEDEISDLNNISKQQRLKEEEQQDRLKKEASEKIYKEKEEQERLIEEVRLQKERAALKLQHEIAEQMKKDQLQREQQENEIKRIQLEQEQLNSAKSQPSQSQPLQTQPLKSTFEDIILSVPIEQQEEQQEELTKLQQLQRDYDDPKNEKRKGAIKNKINAEIERIKNEQEQAIKAEEKAKRKAKSKADTERLANKRAQEKAAKEPEVIEQENKPKPKMTNAELYKTFDNDLLNRKLQQLAKTRSHMDGGKDLEEFNSADTLEKKKKLLDQLKRGIEFKDKIIARSSDKPYVIATFYLDKDQAELEAELLERDINKSGNGKSNDDDGLYNDQIDRIMKNIPEFKGCIMRDEIGQLPNIQKHSRIGFIINTDKHSEPGTHWDAILIDARPEGSNSIEWFDSFGRNMPDDILRSCKQLVSKLKPTSILKLKQNRVIHQSDDTANCGWFCIQFLIDRLSRNKTFSEASGYDDRMKINNINKDEKEIERFKNMPKFKYLLKDT
jgi:hypothetical protein